MKIIIALLILFAVLMLTIAVETFLPPIFGWAGHRLALGRNALAFA